MTTVPEIVVAIERAFDAAAIPHAFGGALALGYHVVEPRGTRDVDVNCFVPADNPGPVFESLPREIAWTDDDVATVEEVAQVRVFWRNDIAVDIFFTNHPFHDIAADNAERVPFENLTIPVLGANELAVFKAFFNRTRDWGDIEAMVDANTVDLHAVIGWIVDLVGANDERITRLRSLLNRQPPDEEPRFAS
jgi:hypothetical protein